MILQFKNQQIYFALESIWPNLHHRFKTELQDLVIANPDEEYIQTVDVPEAILMQIFKAVSTQPEGVAAVINQQMLAALEPQIAAASNINMVMQELEPPNEASRIIIAITEFSAQNATAKANKILNGKDQILTS